SVGEQAAILPGERHSLRHALIDYTNAQLGEPIDVCFARAKVAALDGIVEQPIDAVAIVLVVLRRVDAALGGDAVGASRRILKAECVDAVSELTQRRRRGASG